MFIKRYVGRTVGEALDQIRSELGRDAVILSQKKMKARGLAGLFGQRVIEIVAGIDEGSQVGAIAETQAKEPLQSVGSVQTELQDIKAMLGALVTGEAVGGHSHDLTAVMQQLTGTSLSHDLLLRFLRLQSRCAVTSCDASKEALEVLVAEIVEGVGEVRTIGRKDRIVTFIGPTGVGKTTTVAKIAAIARLRENRQVGLLTLDTFRVAAVEQLRTYAEILNVPFAVARTAHELKQQLDNWTALDLVLIDTTGRSFLDQSQATELKNLLAAISPDLTYLVLSASARHAESYQVASQLEHVGYDALLFTKLDETIMPSLILTMIDELQRPLSYFTMGQQVPNDLLPADIPTLQSYFCGGETLARSS